MTTTKMTFSQLEAKGRPFGKVIDVADATAAATIDTVVATAATKLLYITDIYLSMPLENAAGTASAWSVDIDSPDQTGFVNSGTASTGAELLAYCDELTAFAKASGIGAGFWVSGHIKLRGFSAATSAAGWAVKVDTTTTDGGTGADKLSLLFSGFEILKTDVAGE